MRKGLLRESLRTIVGGLAQRRRTSEALNESEERYRQLVELSPDAILVHQAGKVVFVNSSAMELFGAKEPEELIGKDVMALVHPDFREIVEERSHRIQQQGELVPRVEQKSLRLDGTAFDIEVSSAPILHRGTRASLTMIRDITDRKHSEAALRRRVEEMAAFQATLLEITTPRELSQLLNVIVERAVHLLKADGGGLYLFDAEREVARCMVSYNTPVDYVGTTLSYGEGAAGVVAQTGEPLLLDDYSAWSRRAGVFEKGRPFRAVASVPLLWQGRATGVIHVLRYKEHNPFDPSDVELLSLFASHAAIAAENARLVDGLERELSERKGLEAERETAIQRLEFVISATGTGIDIIGPDFTVVYVDPARKEVFGEMAGRKCYQYFRGRESPCGDCVMMRALATRKIAVAEQPNPASETLPIQVTAIPYQVESGEWMVAEVGMDISERKHAEEERLDLERRVLSAQKLESMAILAGGVAHNFNNFLSIMLGNAELLRETLGAEPDAMAQLKEITKAGYRSRDLVGQLLAMGRRQVLLLQPVDLNEVIRDCIPLLRKAVRDNIVIEYQLSPSACPVTADPGRLEEVLLNLVMNAQDAIRMDGRLVIGTSELLPDIQLTVADTGGGMDEATIARIFDPFFTTKEKGKGTGLGLSTVYGIVKQHNGNVEVASEPGKGTRFVISLPRTENPLRGTVATEQLRPRGGSETILVVDDEEPVRQLVSRHLRSLGYVVLEASDGNTALRVFDQHHGVVHLLLTDVVMPLMSGRELLDRICLRAPGTRVLFMSGYGQDVVLQHSGRQGKIPLLTKPFSRDTMAARLREILDTE